MAAKKKTAARRTSADVIARDHPVVVDAAVHGDSLTNVITGLGSVDRDVRRWNQIIRSAVPGSAELDTRFTEGDLEHNIVAIPAEDMTREWIDLLGDGDVPAHLESRLEAVGARAAMFESLLWSRLHGTALCVVGLGGQRTKVDAKGKATKEPDLELPAQTGKGKAVEWLRVFDRWEVSGVELDDAGNVELYSFILSDAKDEEWRVHASRVLRFDADPMPRRMREEAEWGLPVLHRCKGPIDDLDLTMGSVAVAMQRFSETVLKMKKLTALLTQDKGKVAQNRIAALNMMRSTLGMMLLDAEEDDIVEIKRDFGGVPDMLDRMVERVASAARMPVSLLMGRSPAGLNATGDSDLRWWYSHVASLQQTKLRPALWRLIELVAQGDGLDLVESKVELTFNALWKMTEKEEAETHLTQAQADHIMIEDGVLGPEEIRENRFSRTGYSVQTVVEADDPVELDEEDDIDPDDLDDEGNPKPKPTPGAPPTGGDVQKSALNGAQVTSAVEIVTAVATRDLPRDTGIGMLESFFSLTAAEAEKIMGTVGKTFFAEKPAATPVPGPADDDDPAPVPPKKPPPFPPREE